MHARSALCASAEHLCRDQTARLADEVWGWLANERRDAPQPIEFLFAANQPRKIASRVPALAAVHKGIRAETVGDSAC